MRVKMVFILTAAVLAVCSCDEEAVDRSAESASVVPPGEPLVAICCRSPGRVVPREEPADGQPGGLVAALWPNGAIVWSDDRLRGGPPYRTGCVDAGQVEAMLACLRNEVFGDAGLEKEHLGPDSSYLEIRLVDGPRRLRMRSWHELFEDNDALVATAGGIVQLGGRDREQVLAGQPGPYRRFRSIWDKIRLQMSELTPDQGDIYSGPFVIAR